MRALLVAAAAATVPLLALAPAQAKKPAAAPTFASYPAPPGLGESAGEPSLGVDPSGAVLFQSLLETLRVTGLGTGTTRWRDVAPLHTQIQTQDPILETDAATGRTWVSQLDLACSRVAYTDDGGTSWTPSAVGCAAGALFDHQSIGSGPWVPGPLADLATYPRAVYYCAHDGFDAKCGTSVDGGATFLPARVTHTGDVCTSNSGSVKTAPDGTVYLPPTYCGVDFGPVVTRKHMGLVVSEDNGLTWAVRPVPGSTVGSAGHPSVGVATDGTVYYAWGGLGTGEGYGPPYAAVTRDRGLTWSVPRRLGTEHGIENTRFVTTVAGDGDRAAVAYLGSPAPGVADAATFAGTWHLYVSFTYDGGLTWRTVNATPGQPVQAGAVCLLGSVDCAGGTRNLYDFQDAVLDAQGRVLVAVADGCPGTVCTTTAPRAQKATIVRQETGRGLLAAYDGAIPAT